jgi:hypothetical protein
MDGYPDGHGQELADFLDGFKIVNGISTEDRDFPKVANGMGCLAAQVIAHFKTDTSHYRQMNELAKKMQEAYPDKPSYHQEYPERDFRIGSFYMVAPGETDAWQDYSYTVYVKSLGPDESHPYKKEALELRMRCETEMTTDWETDTKKNIVMFDGKPEDFDPVKASEVSEKAYEGIHGKDE